MTDRLDQRLVAGWLSAAKELGVRVVAPYALVDADEQAMCEVFLPDFGSPTGALFVSAKTERRIRAALRTSGLWTSIERDGPKGSSNLSHYISTLEDFGWFGPPEERPAWLRGA